MRSLLTPLIFCGAILVFSASDIEAKRDKKTDSSRTSLYRHFLSGLIFDRHGEMEKALQEYNAVLSLEPTATVTYKQRAQTYLKMGQPEKALRDIQEYVRSHPEDTDTSLLLANIHISLGQRYTAKLILEKILQEKPTQEEALLALGNLLTTEESEKALKILLKLIRLRPDAVEAYYSLGFVYQKLGNLPKSKESFEKVIEMDKDSIQSLILLGQISENTKDLDSASRYFEEALKKSPENFALRMQLLQIYARQKQWDKMEPVLEPYKNDPNAPQEVKVWLGTLYEIKKEYGQAIFYYKGAEKESKNPALLVHLATLYSESNQPKKALQVLRVLTSRYPQDPQFHYLLGLAYADLKKPRKAIPEFAKAAELKQDYGAAYFQMGVLWDGLQEWSKAEIMFKEAIRIDSANASAYNYLGYTYADKNLDLYQSRKWIEKALELDPANPAYLDSLGWLNFREGRVEAALKHLETAVQNMSDPIIFDHLGDCYAAKGDLEKAIQSYTASLQIDSENRPLQKKIKATQATWTRLTSAQNQVRQFEQNLRKFPYLSMTFQIRVAGRKIADISQGLFYFRKKERQDLSLSPLTELRIDLLDSSFLAFLTLRYQNDPESWSVFPAESKGQIPPETKSILKTVTHFLNGELFRPFSQKQVLVKESKKHFLLNNGPMSLKLEKSRGTVTDFQDEAVTLKINETQNIQGVNLPRKMEFQISDSDGKKSRGAVTIEFLQFSLDKIEDKVFAVQQKK
ncbi:MAG: tetratricopeptide repeat protein [Elusimicrobia bacterium]|nr:tetratricopeptide repeat protein [Elusimicrobiota bacterium]